MASLASISCYWWDHVPQPFGQIYLVYQLHGVLPMRYELYNGLLFRCRICVWRFYAHVLLQRPSAWWSYGNHVVKYRQSEHVLHMSGGSTDFQAPLCPSTCEGLLDGDTTVSYRRSLSSILRASGTWGLHPEPSVICKLFIAWFKKTEPQ